MDDVAEKALDKRFRDVELIMRVMALNKYFSKYEKPMKTFLNDFLESQKGEEKSFALLGKRFGKACDVAFTELGSKPFHLRGRLNYGVLDSVLSRLMDKPNVANLKTKFTALTKNAAYVKAVTYNTSDENELRARFSLAKKKLT